jgi:hypothetical protein
VAVTLIECMTTQLKLYEEWIEVMDDYATVFCHDKNKGVPSQVDHTTDGANALVSMRAVIHLLFVFACDDDFVLAV